MIDIGSVLKAARENTNLSQREFAERLGVDQSKISRVEVGGAVVSDDELERWLSVLRPEDAKKVRCWLQTPWAALEEPQPSWNHSDISALAEAAGCANSLISAKATIPPSLVPSIERILREIRSTAASLRSVRYRVALVGGTAAGKSTAVAHGLELRTPSGDAVLPTGGGTTTGCEILIEQGQQWGIVVESEPREEIVRLVEDLCASYSATDRPVDERPAVPAEVRNALLNMAGMAAKTEIGPDGHSVRREPLRELVEQQDVKRTVSTVLLALRLAERTTTEMWWEPGAASDPMTWLRDNLRKINRGLHPAVSLPRRVRVIAERPILTGTPYAATFIDTRGVADTVVRRQDLADCLSNERTVTLLCSLFQQAPDLYIRHLMQYADEQEFQGWRTRAAVLLLARSGDPGQVRYEDTDELVDNRLDGIRIKEAHTRQQLAEVNTGNVAIATYDAHQDLPGEFRAVVLARIDAMREEDRRRISSLARTARDMLINAEKHAIQAARAVVARDVLLAMKIQEDAAGPPMGPHTFLLRQVAAAHPRSVWAMTRRRGTWRALSLELHLSDGAAQVAREWVHDPLVQLEGLLAVLATKPELHEALGLVEELREVAKEAKSAFVARARDTAAATIWIKLRSDLQLWADCEAEWNDGPGFRDRVVRKLAAWFEANDTTLQDFNSRLQTAWRERFIHSIKQLCSELASS